ncbi:hypothetical protein FCL40_08530 [Ferrimonas sediminicola]|uniref:Toxin CptA n=1 Tax=Ferrimonas sediminicola TaxID=2569538 RepID=A0A4U1BG22_9GAMM|nr:hypothetical protein [Ferrimonas sediminicola]TKB49370.1 hypothetical protein FCL40_08530 [Ferrimonas sediminicola]
MVEHKRYPYPAPSSCPNWLRLGLSLLLLLSLGLWPAERLPLQGAWQLLLLPVTLLPWLPRGAATSPFLLGEDGQGVELGGGEPFQLDPRSWVWGPLALLWVQPGGRLWWLSRRQVDRAGWHRLCRILISCRGAASG